MTLAVRLVASSGASSCTGGREDGAALRLLFFLSAIKVVSFAAKLVLDFVRECLESVPHLCLGEHEER